MLYVFADWRIDTLTREAWRDGQAVALPRAVFDLVACLLARRERAVTRDELLAAVWGRADIAGGQLSQLVAEARALLGDDGEDQAVICSEAAGGYRWILPVDESPDSAPVAPAVTAETAAPPVAVSASMPPPRETQETSPRMPRRHRLLVGSLLAAALCAAIATTVLGTRRLPPATPPPGDAAQVALAVLPAEVEGPADMQWLRLGLMDHVASRLRSAGLAVLPGDSVLAAQRQAGQDESGQPELARLQQVLGTQRQVLVQARAITAGWRISLQAPDTGGVQRRVEAEQAEAVAAGRAATDLLLAALGKAGAAGNEVDTAVDSLIARSQAAVLDGDVELAHRLFDGATPEQRSRAEVKLLRAQIDQARGQLDSARQQLDALLAQQPGPTLRARALLVRGALAEQRGDCAAAGQAYGEALQGEPDIAARALAGRGRSHSCLDRPTQAMEDLGLARLRLQAAGDRLGMARIDHDLGIAALRRERLEEALAHFSAAQGVFGEFGIAEARQAALSARLDTQIHLLHWPEALADAAQLRQLRAEVTDPAQRQLIDSDRARALLGHGRWQEAGEILDAAGSPLSPAARRYLGAVRAELAWRQGDADAARAAAQDALAEWPARTADVRRAALLLVLQRAGGDIGAFAPPVEAAAGLPLLRLAAAEASAQAAQDAAARDGAEILYAEALTLADARAIPAVQASVTVSYAQWLLDRGRADEAAALSLRLQTCAATDFDCAGLRVALFQVRGERNAWAAGLAHLRELAGERPIAAALQAEPVEGP